MHLRVKHILYIYAFLKKQNRTIYLATFLGSSGAEKPTKGMQSSIRDPFSQLLICEENNLFLTLLCWLPMEKFSPKAFSSDPISFKPAAPTPAGCLPVSVGYNPRRLVNNLYFFLPPHTISVLIL